MADYIVGDLVRVTANFTDIEGTLTDPSQINLGIKYPSNDISYVTYSGGEIERDSIGVYYYDIDVDTPGVYKIYWWSEGPAQGAGQDLFYVIHEFPVG